MLKSVLIAVDDGPAASAALAAAITLATREGAALHLVHVLDETTVDWGEHAPPRQRRLTAALADSARIIEQARAMIQAAGRPVSWKRLHRSRTAESVGRLIAAEAEARGADLIVIGAPRRGRLGRVWHGGLPGALRRRGRVPVLEVAAADTHAGGLAPAAPLGAAA
jgi:nucleotide-binding universal stress UspA family protein